MKIFLKTLFIFLCFIFFQGSFANNVPADIFTSENYIQNHHENIVLTSETMRGLEIFSQEGDANQQFSQVLISGIIPPSTKDGSSPV